MLERGMAKPIIGGALVAVLEHVVGLVEFLEFVDAVLIARIVIGVVLHGELAERGLELDLGAGAGDAQHFVVVALRHFRIIPAEEQKNLVLREAPEARREGRGFHCNSR